jgi:hypothetical protein
MTTRSASFPSASLASSLARGAGVTRHDPMPVAGPQAWKASLVSNQRGQLVTRRAETREAAIATACRLLDESVGFPWLHGETLSVAIQRDDG